MVRDQAGGGTVTDSYEYDSNGNMTCRIENDNGVQTYKHSYNAENRLSKIELVTEGACASPTTITDTWEFFYDGDGTRVKEIYSVGGTEQYTRIFFGGGSYEVTLDSNNQETGTKKYYSFAGMLVAMDDGTNLRYFASDHLSSASLVMDDAGNLLSEQRYMPFGEVREDVSYSNWSNITDFGYTGQRDYGGDFGLMDYRARFYSPRLGRFTQPDTIVPDMNPQSLNRLSYVNNNPIIYIDPTGHELVHCAGGRVFNAGCGGDGGTTPGGDSYPSNDPPQYCQLMPEECEETQSGENYDGVTLLFCGSYGGDRADEVGPSCDLQMPAWVGDGVIPIQYPGSKYKQFLAAIELDIPLSADIILVCYSAGTEACLMYANWRLEAGGNIQAIVLIGPTFSGENEFGVDTDGFEDWESHLNYILSQGVDVLIVDDGSPWNTNGAEGYKKSPDAYGDFGYLLVYTKHYGSWYWFGSNDTSWFRDWIYGLIKMMARPKPPENR